MRHNVRSKMAGLQMSVARRAALGLYDRFELLAGELSIKSGIVMMSGSWVNYDSWSSLRPFLCTTTRAFTCS
jgi:hypothetical protein